MNFQGRAWAHNEAIPLEWRVVRWSYESMLEQRNISLNDIGEYLGVTKQAVHLWLNGITNAYNDSTRETLIERLDEAITGISRERHDAVSHDYCAGRETFCVPILLETLHRSRGDLRVAEAKFRGEVELFER